MKLALISSIISSSRLKELLNDEYRQVEIEQFDNLPDNIEGWAQKPEHFCAVVDINICKKDQFRLLSLSREIPVIISLESIDDQNSRKDLEEAIIRGAQGYLESALEKEQLIDYLYPQYDRLKHCDSYSNTIIDSFVAFHSAHDIAAKMISIAKIVCRGYGIPNAERADIYRALKILAVAIKTNSIIKTIKFFEDIRIAKAILEILKSSIKPDSLKSNIIHMIYNFQRVLHHNRELKEYETKTGDRDVYLEVLRIFERKEIFLEKNLNLESIWIDIIEATNNCQEVDANVIDDFIRYANIISKYSIIYCRGAIVKILKSGDTIEYLLTLQKEHYIFDDIYIER